MKKQNIIFIVVLLIILFSNSIVYGAENKNNKAIVLILDELNFETIDEILNEGNYGIGFMSIKTRKPYGDESLYFSLATGRKVGVKQDYYKGLYKDEDGVIHILGFEKLYTYLKERHGNIQLNFLGDKLKAEGISFIGENPSAIIAANSKGEIGSGELIIDYDINWLINKTEEHLSKSNILVLSYEIGETKSRITTLKNYIDNFKDHNIILIPNKVAANMKYFINNSLVPIIYIDGQAKGLLKSPSTKREGLITLGDIHSELTYIVKGENEKGTGNRIEIVENKNNFKKSKDLYSRTINLIFIATIFHGIVYFLQCYVSYLLNKNRLDRLYQINLYNNFLLISIFLSLLMGISSLHINIFLYLLINLLVTYIITVFIVEKEVDGIGLFASLTYGIILIGIFFYPELIYNSYIGFNNLFYGARYYGFNNGIMGVLLVSSIVSYYSIEKLIENNLIKNIVCILYFFTNMVALSANYGTNTGGFITSVILFLIMIYINILNKDFTIKNIIILLLVSALIFGINMYLDYHSENKSHAIGFLMRICNFGFGEFIDMFKIKFKELVKWSLLPPFSIVIIAQILSIKKLKKIIPNYQGKYNIIILIALIGFILNDTGMITFIYMIHYLISLIIYENFDQLHL